MTRSGNTMLITVLIVIVVAVAGVMVYYGMQSETPPPSTTANTVANTSSLDPADEQQLNSEIPTAPTVTDTDDLDAAAAALDQTDLNAGTTDSEQLGSYAEEF